MFMGEYNHTVDAKGRLIVPSKFREQLGDEFVVTKGLDGCLFVYENTEWKALEEKLHRQHCDPVQSDVRSGCPLCQSDQHGDHAALHHHDATDDHPVSDVTAQKIATGFIRLSPFFT